MENVYIPSYLSPHAKKNWSLSAILYVKDYCSFYVEDSEGCFVFQKVFSYKIATVKNPVMCQHPVIWLSVAPGERKRLQVAG